MIVRSLLLSFLISFSFLSYSFCQGKEKPISVVTTFSIAADLIKQVGQEKVHVKALVGPNKDVHGYHPVPHDAISLKKAQLVFINGLGLEGWLEQFITSSGFKGQKIVLTEGIKPIVVGKSTHGKTTFDPHAWHSFHNIKIYVKNIEKALIAVDPQNQTFYAHQASLYLAKIVEAEKWALDLFKSIPLERRVVITVHDAFEYLGRDYNLKLLAPLGVNPDAHPAPKDLAKLIEQIKKYNVKSIFLEPIIDSRLVKQIAETSKIKVGEILYSDALSDQKGRAPTYLDLMRYNLSTMAHSMRDIS
jgi:zinc/manganese transport system substrate-binding protein